MASGTASVTSVAASASSVTLLSTNSGRLGATIYNDSQATVYIKFGTTASTTSFNISLGKDEYAEINTYTGRIDAIWTSATGSARITELTA